MLTLIRLNSLLRTVTNLGYIAGPIKKMEKRMSVVRGPPCFLIYILYKYTIYIQKTINLSVRFYTYYSLASLAKSNRPIDRALLKYGFSNFSLEILVFKKNIYLFINIIFFLLLPEGRVPPASQKTCFLIYILYMYIIYIQKTRIL